MAVWSVTNFEHARRAGRFDSEYFSPEMMKLEARLDTAGSLPLHKLCRATCSAFYPAAADIYVDKGIPFLRCLDAITYPVLLPEQPYECLPEKFFHAHKNIRHVKPGDILITKVGTPCYASLLHVDMPQAALSRTVLGLTHIDKTKVDPRYLTAFLRAYSGFQQLMRERELTIQYQLTLERTLSVKVYLPSFKLQRYIGSIYDQYVNERRRNQALLAEAEATLNSTLGLDRVDFAPQLFYEDRFSRVVAAGRFDAEHFQPKFAALLDTLRNTGIELQPLGEIIKPVKNGFDCRNFCDEGTPYIRVGDVKQGRIEIDGCARIPLKAKELPKDVTLAVGDILFTRKGSFGNAAHVRPGFEHAIISSEIMLIRRKNAFLETILPEYLALYLNSKAGALQAEKWAHGVAFYSISQDDLTRFVIPILPMPKQKDLKAKTDEAESALQESRRLLDTAKRAVEIAIEDGEEAARTFLDREAK